MDVFKKVDTPTICIICLVVVVLAVVAYLWYRRSTQSYQPNLEGPVQEAEANNDKRAREAAGEEGTGPTLVLFHLHGCGPCGKLMPEWDKLQNSDKLKLVKIEASDPRIARFGATIKGFPTIRLFPAGLNSTVAVDFTGERSANGIMTFVNTSMQQYVQSLQKK